MVNSLLPALLPFEHQPSFVVQATKGVRIVISERLLEKIAKQRVVTVMQTFAPNCGEEEVPTLNLS